MKRFAINVLFLLVIMLGISVSQSWAQSTKPLKGNWIFMAQTSAGIVPIPFSFKNAGKGTLIGPAGKMNLAYREKGSNFSLTFEFPNADPMLGDVTLTIRGMKVDDKTIVGDSIIITDMPDPASVTGRVTVMIPGSVNGKRQ